MKINHSKPYFDSTDESALCDVLKDAFISAGERNRRLAELLSQILKKKYVIATQSGTDALSAALRVMKLKKGAKVAVPAYICSAPLDAVALNSLSPVPVDIDRETLAISIDQADRSADTVAIIAAHLFGIPAPFYKIKHPNLIEDCAQTLGTEIDGNPIGSMGEFAICSFYATKLLTSGHGGAVAVNDKTLFEEINDLFNHDKRDIWYPHWHFALSDLNAALAVSQLQKLDFFLKERKIIAGKYCQALGEGKGLPKSIFSRFLVIAEGDFSDLLAKFHATGIEAKRPVYKPIFQYLGLDPERYPNAQWAHEHIISVPLYPGMTDAETDYIATFLEENRNEMRCWPPA